MTRRSLLFLACACLGSFQSLVAAEFSFGELTLTVPDGFTIERIAHSPLVDRPIMADLDDQGRLYVADSSGSNDNVQTQLREKPHRIVRLEDRDGDGVYDESVVFADKLMFPAGVLWTDGVLYVAAPPVIWKLTDTDDDGICDQREVWHDGKTLTGCANDLHGPYLGPDGWIYWCKGAFAEQTYPQPNGSPFVSRAAHVFRKHPNGSHVEPVMTGGMDNPVELVFTPEGERFFTTTFLQHPGGGRRDGIIHAIYGGVYGKDHDVLDGHPRTGDLMPVMTHQGPAASCALLRTESKALGANYQGNLFSSLFNMRKVMRHELIPDGATYRTVDHDFLTGDHIDFHPTDVLEDVDGSLLIVDTGGWYKLCCPTSQLPKPEVLGAIYRIKRIDGETTPDPLGKTIDWEQLDANEPVNLLTDPRPRVVRRALDHLVQKGDAALPALAKLQDPLAKQQAIWALCRMNTPEARAAVRSFLTDASPKVCHTALHAVSVHRDREAAPAVAKLLQSTSPAVQRVAAECLGRIGTARDVPSLLAALAKPCDRVLEHSLRYALIEIADDEALFNSLNSKANPFVLDALYQRRSSKLTSKQTLPYLKHQDAALREVAWKIVVAHPNWSAVLVKELPGPSKLSSEAQQALSQLANHSDIQAYLSKAISDPEQHAAVLHVIEHANLQTIPDTWLPTFDTLLQAPSPETRLAALNSLSRVKTIKLPALHKLALNDSANATERLQALEILIPSEAFPAEAVPFLINQLQPAATLQARQRAANILTKIALSKPHSIALAQSLATVGPMELQRLTTHLTSQLAKNRQENLATLMLEALAKNPSAPSLPPATVQQLLAAAPRSDAKMAFEKAVPLTSIADQEARLQSMLATLPDGDITRGQAVFNSTEAACVTCHAMGYIGGQLGPDLTRIGQIRSQRDLLEAILYPSASFVRSYETLLVTMTDGQMHLGIQKSQNDQALTLRTGPATESAIERKQIHHIEPGPVSLMPPGLDTIMSPQQLSDLLAFLQNAK